MRLGFLIISFLQASTLLADVKTFSYRISHADQPWGGRCNQVALELKTRFETFTGKKVSYARCEESEYTNTISLNIKYESEEKVNVVQTDLLDVSGGTKAAYSTLKECSEDLPRRVETFESETGLKAFVSFCFSNSYLSVPSWSFYIDGFGTPLKSPQLKHAYVDIRPYDINKNEIAAIFKEKFRERGANLDLLTFRPDMGVSKIGAFFYSKSEINFGNIRIVEGLPLASCHEAAKMVTTAIENSGVDPIVSFCGSHYSNPKTFELTALFFDDGKKAKISYAEEGFDKLETCLAQQSDLENKYKNDYGWPITGSVCGLRSNKVRLVFIDKP